MQRRILSGVAIGVCLLGPLWSGCATQQDTDARSSSSSTAAAAGQAAGGSADAGSGGKSGASSASAGSFASSGNAAGGTAGSAGTMNALGGEPGTAGADAESGGAGGAQAECSAAADCDDADPCTSDACLLQHCSHTANTAPCEDDEDQCTTDVCSLGVCTHPDSGTCECQGPADCDDDEVCTNDTCTANECVHTNNTLPCADDGSACTADVCSGGECAHSDNQTCECLKAADCNDADPCTFNQCNAAGACVYPDNGTCGVGTPFTVNSFNSSADWTANKTTPDGRALVDTGFTNPNLEGDANVYLAANVASSLEMNVASMTGLGKLRIVMRCVQADTASMVHVGVWNGAAWSEKQLLDYAQIPTATYATIELPLVDFGVALDLITKMRLRFAPTGGLKEWRIDEISVAK